RARPRDGRPSLCALAHGTGEVAQPQAHGGVPCANTIGSVDVCRSSDEVRCQLAVVRSSVPSSFRRLGIWSVPSSVRMPDYRSRSAMSFTLRYTRFSVGLKFASVVF
ncbi:hypothetical protein CSUI_009224, partial [Cystoisospora suis]